MIDFIDNIEVSGEQWFSANDFLLALGYKEHPNKRGVCSVLYSNGKKNKFYLMTPVRIVDGNHYWNNNTLVNIKRSLNSSTGMGSHKLRKWDSAMAILESSLPKPKQTLLQKTSHVDYKVMYENVLNDHQKLKKATDVLKLKFDKDTQKIQDELKLNQDELQEAQELIKQLKESPKFDADTELFLDQYRNELKRLRHENEKIENLEIKLLREYKNIRTLEGKLSKAETVNKQLETTIRVLEEKLKTANLTTLKSKEILDKKISVVAETIVDNVILGFKVGNKTTIETKEYRLEDLIDLDIKAIKL